MKPAAIRWCLLLLAACGVSAAVAQQYPVRPVRLVVPFAPGGPMDILSRAIGEKLTLRLGQQIIVDNRGGASGLIGAGIVARAAPDGHTLLAGHSGTHVVNVSLFRNPGYDPVRDFAPITLTAVLPMALVVHPAIPARSAAELIAVAKAKPEAINFATASSGGPTHMAAELFRSLSGVKIVHVPYSGNAAALNDLMAGRVQMMFSNLLTVRPLAEAGRLRILGVSTAARVPQMPELPTLAESGVAGYDYSPWFAMFAPAATSPVVLHRLHREISQVLDDAAMRQRFSAQGVELTASSPEALAALIRTGIPQWRRIIKQAGITAG